MRKKDRLEKKRRKRRLESLERVLRRMDRIGMTRLADAAASDFIRAKLNQPSFAGMIFAPTRMPAPPLEPAVVDDTGVVHWTGLVPKGGQPRETWPRVTLCDANTDLEQAGCALTHASTTCVECIAREGA